ncbi:MAG: PEP-CTERM sorting domain-containing protein [Lacipirellulaceae bacterium]
MKRLISATCLSLLTLCGLLAANAPAQTVLFSDTFARTTGSGLPNGHPGGAGFGLSDWGTNDNGLGGTISMAYTAGPTRTGDISNPDSGSANSVTDGLVGSTIEGSARFDFDITTMAPSGFTVEFDFNRFHEDNPPDPFAPGAGYVSVGFGTEDDDVQGGGAFNVNNADLTILFQQDIDGNDPPNQVGNIQIFEDSVQTDGVAIVDGMELDPSGNGRISYGDPVMDHSVKVQIVPAVNGAYGDADVLNVELTVDSVLLYSFSTVGGIDFGTLSLASNGFVHREYDNLVVTALASDGLDGDINDDMIVDGADFLEYQRDDAAGIPTWEGNYGATSAVASVGSVPEPSAILLLVSLLAGCSARRHR